MKTSVKLLAHASCDTPLLKKITSTSDLKATRKYTVSLSSKVSGNFGINGKVSGDRSEKSKFKLRSNFEVKYTDKFVCDNETRSLLSSFSSVQKLYPTADITTEINGNSFINEVNSPSSLFSSVDEGISVGNYDASPLVSDDLQTFIHPSALYTDGLFRYKCAVSTPFYSPVESLLSIRAAAPVKNYASSRPPIYRLHDIYLKDPYDTVIIKYQDIDIIGDSNYNDWSRVNFTTYILRPEVNNTSNDLSDPISPKFEVAKLSTQDGDRLITESGDYFFINDVASPYTLTFDLDIICNQESFSERFNIGYESQACNAYFGNSSSNDYLAHDGAPFATQSLAHQINPSPHIRITAIEIANAGAALGFIASDSLNMNMPVESSGVRLQRVILPNQLQITSFQNDIYPSGYENLWSSDDDLYNNSDTDGSNELVNILRVRDTKRHVTLSYSEVLESGKMVLRFSHEPPIPYNKYTNGAFNIGFNNPVKEFDYAKMEELKEVDSYFDIDEIFLRVIAKKDPSSADYTIDAVGYSNDRLLFVTPSIGGFLQNIEGTGVIPEAVETFPSDHLGISSETISDISEISTSSTTANDGGDHYLVAEYADLAQTTKINSTEFTEYLIPLKIYEDSLNNTHHNVSLCSYFENLYLDICPIPSGASISHISLVATYAPSNALCLYTRGHGDKEIGSANAKFFTSPRKAADEPLNTGPGYGPISNIENIPHGYGFDNTIKTNYSRRWRNIDGLLTVGPFNVNEFDFSFYNPQMSKPFFGGYYSFNDDVGNDIISEEIVNTTVLQGSYVGNYDKIHNVGLRFKSDSLFSSPTAYTTIDWTSIAGYENDPLYGKIADAFDNAIRVSGVSGYISLPDFDTSEGFVVFCRFSPDIDMSGVNYNYYNSGVLFSKYDNASDLEFALGYNNGFLTAYATDDQGQLVTIQDTKPYHEYTYPLSVLLAYNNGQDSKLTLFTDDEYDSVGFQRQRAQSDPFTIISGNSVLNFGYSSGSGVGVNAFITDIGLSAPTTQTFDTPLFFNANSFLDSIHTKYWDVGEETSTEDIFVIAENGQTLVSENGQLLLSQSAYSRDTNQAWSFVDKDLDEWRLGSFNMCQFDNSFDKFTKRVGQNYITHRIVSDGLAYSDTTDLSLPSSVDTNTSYHSQIENDMLRINLAPEPDSFGTKAAFYTVTPRIINSLIRGYRIFKEAFMVDTVIEHVTYDDIVWEDGNIGPKFIVSLYTRNKDDEEKPFDNLGLINRSIHYLQPSGCIHKISSVFDFEDLFNENNNESWSNFDQSQNKSELEEKYYFNDVEKMFVQYDIVYPSGNAYDSSLTILGTTVILTEALHTSRTINNL